MSDSYEDPCETTAEILEALVADELDLEQEGEPAREHVEGCEHCREALAQTSRVLTQLKQAGDASFWGGSAPHDGELRARIVERLAKERADEVTERRRSLWFTAALSSLAAAAVAIFFIAPGPQDDISPDPQPAPIAAVDTDGAQERTDLPDAAEPSSSPEAETAGEPGPRVVAMATAELDPIAPEAPLAWAKSVPERRDEADQQALREVVAKAIDRLVDFGLEQPGRDAILERLEAGGEHFVYDRFAYDYESGATADEPGQIGVRVAARLDEARIEEALMAAGIVLRRLGRPRLVTFFDESELGDAAGACDEAVTTALRREDFTFGSIPSKSAKLLAPLGDRPDELVEALRRPDAWRDRRRMSAAAGAELLLVGHCEGGTGSRELELEVFAGDTGDIVGSERTPVEMEALLGLGVRLAQSWQRRRLGMRTVTVSVTAGADHERVRLLRERLGDGPIGARAVTVDAADYRTGVAELRLLSVRPPDELLDWLTTAGPGNSLGEEVEVVEIGPHHLELQLRDAKD